MGDYDIQKFHEGYRYKISIGNQTMYCRDDEEVKRCQRSHGYGSVIVHRMARLSCPTLIKGRGFHQGTFLLIHGSHFGPKVQVQIGKDFRGEVSSIYIR